MSIGNCVALDLGTRTGWAVGMHARLHRAASCQARNRLHLAASMVAGWLPTISPVA
jgi:hypothetical protein